MYEITKKKLVLWMPGFDVSDLSEDALQDVEGLDASTAHVLSLLSAEPADGKFCF